jgi:hypothetical protein
MPSLFETELVAGTAAGDPLPLTHGTTLAHLSAIIASTMAGKNGIIETRLCNVFNKNLIYTFYGRPAYMKAGDEYSSDPAGARVSRIEWITD